MKLSCVVTVEKADVSLSKKTLTLIAKNTYKLTVIKKISSDSISKWISSNKKVVTVDRNGKITAKSKGTCYITVIMKSGACLLYTSASEATMEEVEKSYAELQSYYESQPEYFGIAVPYFTSKDAKEGPISALLSVADIPRAAIGVEGGVTIDQVQQLVDGFKQALPGFCLLYTSRCV